MTCEQKLNEILEIYSRVTLLSDKNDCKVIRLRHKKLGNELVLHILPYAVNTYEVLREIECENLPKVYDCFTLSDGMLVLEEYIDGCNIVQMAEVGRYKKKDAVKVVRDICQALDVLHNRGIIHRDIKPENIMTNKNGRIVLIDFNTARKMTAKSQDTVVMGTVGYASPEQLGLAQTDSRTDIYALGVLLNVMLTGQHPSKLLAKGHLGRVIRKCTAVNPDERYQSAIKLAKAL